MRGFQLGSEVRFDRGADLGGGQTAGLFRIGRDGGCGQDRGLVGIIRLQIRQALLEELVRQLDALRDAEGIGRPGLIPLVVVPREDAHQRPLHHHPGDGGRGERGAELGPGEFARMDQGKGHRGFLPAA